MEVRLGLIEFWNSILRKAVRLDGVCARETVSMTDLGSEKDGR